MTTTDTRKQYARAWKAWRKANEIRKALTRLTGNRNGPGKAWADETRIIMKRAERQHRRALQAEADEQKEARPMTDTFKLLEQIKEARAKGMEYRAWLLEMQLEALTTDDGQVEEADEDDLALESYHERLAEVGMAYHLEGYPPGEAEAMARRWIGPPPVTQAPMPTPRSPADFHNDIPY